MSLTDCILGHCIGNSIQFPRQSELINLHTLSLYNLIYPYLQSLWCDDVSLTHELGWWAPGAEPLVASGVKSFSYIDVYGMQVGAFTTHCGLGTSFVYIDGRIPVQISYILEVWHPRQFSDLPDLVTCFAVVEWFISDLNLPIMPWDTRCVIFVHYVVTRSSSDPVQQI